MKNFWLTNLFLLMFAGSLRPQLLEDRAAQELSGLTLQKTYNWEFQKARQLIEELRPKYSKHPVLPFLEAMVLSWENMPLEKSNSNFSAFSRKLQEVIDFAKPMLDKNGENVEGIFFSMLAYSLLALHESESGEFLQSVNYGKRAYNYMKKGFKLTEKYPEFHFSTGLYKYYAVQYPETHPIAKPFMMFFPDGSKQQGLDHIAKAIQLSRYSKTESMIYISSIYAKYEKNYYQSMLYSEQLVGLFPNNALFWAKYCEHLIQVGRYAEAELYLAKFKNRSEKLYQVAHNLLNGMLQELYYKNTNSARMYYLKVINSGKYDARYSKDYHAFAYAGLARLSDKDKNVENAKHNYQKALKMTEYEGLKAEAKSYIRSH